MKRAILLLFILPLLSPTYSSEKKEEDIINIAWKQNILIHSIMKNYMKLGANLGSDREVRALDNDIADFEENLYTLSDLSRGTNIEKEVAEILIHWYKFRLMAVSLPANFEAPIFMFRGQEIVKNLSSAIFLFKSSSQKSKMMDYISTLLETSLDIPMYYYANKWGWEAANNKPSKKSWIYQLYIEKQEELEYMLKDKSIISRENEEIKLTFSKLNENYKLSLIDIENKSDTETLIALEFFDQSFIMLCQQVFDKLLE